MKLLYAEDEPALSEAVVDYLTYHKYIVDAVYDGYDAYDYAVSGMPEGFDPSQLPGGSGNAPDSQPPAGNEPSTADSTRSPDEKPTESVETSQTQSGDEETTADSSSAQTSPSDDGNRPSREPSGSWGSGMSGTSNASSGGNLILLAVSVVVLGAGLLIAKLYKRY